MTVSVELRHRFGDFALDAGFEAPAGVTALFGRSGSGKTTIVNAIAGLLRPEEGRVAVDGDVLLDTAARRFVPPHRRRVGYVFQESRLFPHLSVRQNLVYGRRFSDTPRDEAGFDRTVEMLGIGAILSRRPATLSGGEKQRVAIGRALLARPRLLLMDEPLASLDQSRKDEILPFLDALAVGAEVPIIYVSHSVAEVARLANTIVMLDAGRVMASGPADGMLADPRTASAFGVREAGAVLDAVVMRHHGDGLSELAVSAGSLLLPQIAAAPGARVRVRIQASEVLVARDRPSGLSALNILPATVVALHRGEGPGVMVQLAAGEDRLLARVTQRSAEALGLKPGVSCHVILKTVAVARSDVWSAADR